LPLILNGNSIEILGFFTVSAFLLLDVRTPCV